MAEGLSDKQQRILDFVGVFLTEHDYPPSIRDIQQGCDISSTSVVDYNLKRLEERGLIHRDREISRAIQLPGSGTRRRILTVPVLGKIAAGLPIPTPPEVLPEGYEEVEVTEDQTRGRANAFALRVEGTSMIDALINDGDIVILEPRQTADPGEVVAVWIVEPTNSCDDGDMVAVWLKAENETTLKKFFHEGSRIRLQPMNSTMQPFYTSPDNVEVQGKVLSSIRSAW